MSNLNTCKLGLEFEFGTVQGRHMLVEVIHSDAINRVSPESDGQAKLQLDICLPTKVTLKFSGKNANTDTIVDDQGKITADVYVKIVKIDFDGFELNEIFMHKKIKLHTEDNTKVVTSYIGFNGSVDLEFTESDVFKQYLLCNH